MRDILGVESNSSVVSFRMEHGTSSLHIDEFNRVWSLGKWTDEHYSELCTALEQIQDFWRTAQAEHTGTPIAPLASAQVYAWSRLRVALGKLHSPEDYEPGT